MKLYRAAFIACLAMVALGCDESAQDIPSSSARRGENSQEEQESKLFFGPEDLSTGVRGPIAASLYSREKLSQDEINAIQSSLSLTTWPDAAPVDFEVRVEGGGLGSPVVHNFLVLLKTPLEKGFLATSLDLSRVPTRLLTGLRETTKKRPGALMTRVALDSKLLVQKVTSKPAPGGYEVTVQFSGRVRDQRKPGEVVALHSGSRALECVLKQAELLKEEEGTDTLVFTCPGTEPTQIRISADLKNLSDMPLGDMYGGDITADLVLGRVDTAAWLGL